MCWSRAAQLEVNSFLKQTIIIKLFSSHEEEGIFFKCTIQHLIFFIFLFLGEGGLWRTPIFYYVIYEYEHHGPARRSRAVSGVRFWAVSGVRGVLK